MHVTDAHTQYIFEVINKIIISIFICGVVNIYIFLYLFIHLYYMKLFQKTAYTTTLNSLTVQKVDFCVSTE